MVNFISRLFLRDITLSSWPQSCLKSRAPPIRRRPLVLDFSAKTRIWRNNCRSRRKPSKGQLPPSTKRLPSWKKSPSKLSDMIVFSADWVLTRDVNSQIRIKLIKLTKKKTPLPWDLFEATDWIHRIHLNNCRTYCHYLGFKIKAAHVRMHQKCKCYNLCNCGSVNANGTRLNEHLFFFLPHSFYSLYLPCKHVE